MEGKRALQRARHKSQDSSKMDLKGIVCESVRGGFIRLRIGFICGLL